jgi:hypothetical protein
MVVVMAEGLPSDLRPLGEAPRDTWVELWYDGVFYLPSSDSARASDGPALDLAGRELMICGWVRGRLVMGGTWWETFETDDTQHFEGWRPLVADE